jgi:REP element-mobilizing transposase RayT
VQSTETLKYNNMANTFTQLLIHIVFAVKNRDALIQKEWKNDLAKYITGIIQSHKHKLLAIEAMSDHIHILIGYNVNQLIPKLVEEIKTSSNKWINDNKFSKYKFEWQIGYGAFTYSKSQLNNIVKYILNQEKHHKGKSFQEEYIEILEKFDVQYKQEYLFDFFEKN